MIKVPWLNRKTAVLSLNRFSQSEKGPAARNYETGGVYNNSVFPSHRDMSSLSGDSRSLEVGHIRYIRN